MAAFAVTTSPLVRRYTREEFWTLANPPGGGHDELIAGVLYIVPPPDWPHTTAGSRLNRLFSSYLIAHIDGCRHLAGAGSHVYQRRRSEADGP
jgi:Uma2 family endonuclease